MEPAPPRIQPILRPGASPWALDLGTTLVGGMSPRGVTAVLAAGAPAIAGCFLVTTAPVLAVLMIVVSFAAVIGLFAYGFRAKGRDVVSEPDYRFEGVAIEGAALDMLADIQERFRWAERMFREVPAGIRWSEIDHEVRVLLWEAAGHAAKVSAIDVELRALAYADDGTPPAVLRRRLQDERTRLWARLEDTQYEADDLAREASNTAAAARVALARSGSVLSLELVAPTGADLAARGALAAARARLAMLAEVWAELDESTELTAERLGLPRPTDD